MKNKLKTALSAIKSGVPIEEASRDVDWKDFEGLVAEILESKNFEVIRNFRMRKPTMEIDVVGIHLGVAVLIDCKHWKRMTNSALEKIVLRQIDRVKHYVANTDDVVAAPVIVTLYQEETKFVSKVPIVPIIQFSSFIDEFYGNLEEIRTIEK
ncbi:restriction endonuclease [Marine Group I thaumarchaeote]|uniref:Restriction endonuclease n=1 Tax=Marine Group I thaumarchaeote TaxID=2511932 RepID=A0A7K4NSP5_9ARCH|nr:restriction endonuclease [Marine Group I thaumarchaeote]